MTAGGSGQDPEPSRSDVRLHETRVALGDDDFHIDRALRALFRFSPARFAVQSVFNPWNPISRIRSTS